MLDLQSQKEKVLTMSVIPRHKTGCGEQLASLDGILLLGFCGYSGLSTRLYPRDGEGEVRKHRNLGTISALSVIWGKLLNHSGAVFMSKNEGLLGKTMHKYLVPFL